MKIDDKLLINFSSYQANHNNDDNSSIPTILPYIDYNSGNFRFESFSYKNQYQFYNIFRDKKTNNNAKEQKTITQYIFQKYVDFNSNIIFEGQIFNQFFNTTKKDIEGNKLYSGNNFRTFQLLEQE